MAVDAARDEIQALGQPVRAPGAAVVAARIALADGRLDEAAAAADGALGTPMTAPGARSVLVEVALRRGDVRTAERYAQGDALAGGRMREVPDGPRAAVAHLAALYDNLPGHPGPIAGDTSAAARLVRNALAAGDRPRAEAGAAAAEGLARDGGRVPRAVRSGPARPRAARRRRRPPRRGRRPCDGPLGPGVGG
jgi:hypothetical protein